MCRYLKAIFLGSMLLLAGCSSKHYITKIDNVVILSLDSPKANSVLFASSLDRFELHEMINKNGHWSIDHPLKLEFSYFYIVDGKVFVPDCQVKEMDDFGQANCIYQP